MVLFYSTDIGETGSITTDLTVKDAVENAAFQHFGHNGRVPEIIDLQVDSPVTITRSANRLMRESFLESEDDFQWLQDVYGISRDNAVCAILTGNEDAPERIELFRRNHWQEPPFYVWTQPAE
jgi:hypothetical protein